MRSRVTSDDGSDEERRELPGVGAIRCRRGSKREVDFIHHEVFVERSYLQHGITLKPGDTVFDVGANIGLFALFADVQCRGDCRLFCFEPIPETFEFLRRNLQEHGLAQRPSVRLLNVGLTHWGGAERAPFTYFPSAPGNSTQYATEKRRRVHAALGRLMNEARFAFETIGKLPRRHRPFYWVAYVMAYPFFPLVRRRLATASNGREVECRLLTLSAILREYAVEAVDLLKIDVEGAELDVLDGIDDADWPRIRQVSMEAHAAEGQADRIVALLRARGFSVAVERSTWALAFVENNVNVYARRDPAPVHPRA